MSKKSALWIMLDLVFLIVFNTVFFVAGGTEHPSSVWISYGFIHFSYFMILLTPVLTRKSTCSAVFGFSINAVSAAYFFAELILGTIFVFLAQVSYKPSLVSQVILAGLYAIVLLSQLLANEHTGDSVERHEEETKYVQGCSILLKEYIGMIDNMELNKKLERAYDIIHSSPAHSNGSASKIESEIYTKIYNLGNLLHSNDCKSALLLTDEIIMLANKRNTVDK